MNTRMTLPGSFKKHGDFLRTLSEKDIIRIREAKEQRKGIFRLLIFSDAHGLLVDPKARDCLFAVIQENDFDEIVDNGDTLDFPYLSNHSKKINRVNDETDLLRNYDEIKEIEFTRRTFFEPLREISSAKIVKRDGNHDERITKPKKYSKEQLERLNSIFIAYDSSNLGRILRLPELGVEYDPAPIRKYFDMFFLVHGLSVSKYSAYKNLEQYHRSGSSGHTHRLNSTYVEKWGKTMCWIESGCLRLTESVEYFPTAVVANWQQGFVTVTFDLREDPEKPTFYAKTHPIINGSTEYNGKVYSYRDFRK